MRTKFNGILTLLLAFVVQATFAQKTITGTVTDDMGPIPGASVMVEGTQNGTVTDFDGKYSITANTGDVLVFSIAGNSTKKTVGSSNVIDATIGIEAIAEVTVMGARNIKQKARDVVYANQVLKGEDLGIGKDNNLKTALNGKIAGVQVAAQSGAKLGDAGKVYLRGAISATGRSEALYVIDGIETSSENVDMDNVASINVLKGPAAVGLYGLRGANGVIVITTKSGKKGKVSVSVYNNTTFDTVAYLMDYQNEYGQGYVDSFTTFDYAGGASAYGLAAPYPTEWAPLDGQRIIRYNWADESWGPKFDGGQYVPWQAWWPGDADFANPYYGKTEKYEAQPDNIKDYYDTGVTTKTGFSISGGNENATGRLSYSRLSASGALPYSKLTNDNLAAKFNVKLTEKLSVSANTSYQRRAWNGNFSDTYATGTSANFNQWFGRNLDLKKMRELKDLKTLTGHTASWNWWGPDRYTIGTYASSYNSALGNRVKPTFWFNPYYQNELDQTFYTRNRFTGAMNVNYKINEHISLGLNASTSNFNYSSRQEIPYELQFNSAFYAYNKAYINSFSTTNSDLSSIEFAPQITFDYDLSEDLNLNTIIGGTTRTYDYNVMSMNMTSDGENPYTASYGLVIPDLFVASNSIEKIRPSQTSGRESKSKDLFARIKFNYKNYLIVTADVSNVWSSTYDIVGLNNPNSFMFGSIGTSFIFSDLIENKGFLDQGKMRLSYGKVGTTVDRYKINPTNFLGSNSYNNNPLMYSATTAANPSVHPATSAATEVGLDLRMFKSRVNLSATYFNEHRTDEILKTETSSTAGVSNALVNAGDVKRTGIELELGLKVLKSKEKDGFNWDMAVNWSNPKSTVIRLAEGQETQLIGENFRDHYDSFRNITLLNAVGEDWGQLVGNAIKRDAAGNAVVDASGIYQTETAHHFGSVLPDFNGGIVNSFSYKGVTLSGTIAFQKGGKFFSLSEWWGNYTGLLSVTAGDNDLGNPKRDAVADGGGIHVVGVDDTGAPVDTYVDANTYFIQFYDSNIVDLNIHDASYIKLSDISISYKFPKSVIGKTLQSASIGFVARNLGMLALAKDNINNWDPSEMSFAWGEDGGLPGTRSIGFNIKLTF